MSSENPYTRTARSSKSSAGYTHEYSFQQLCPEGESVGRPTVDPRASTHWHPSFTCKPATTLCTHTSAHVPPHHATISTIIFSRQPSFSHRVRPSTGWHGSSPVCVWMVSLLRCIVAAHAADPGLVLQARGSSRGAQGEHAVRTPHLTTPAYPHTSPPTVCTAAHTPAPPPLSPNAAPPHPLSGIPR